MNIRPYIKVKYSTVSLPLEEAGINHVRYTNKFCWCEISLDDCAARVGLYNGDRQILLHSDTVEELTRLRIIDDIEPLDVLRESGISE